MHYVQSICCLCRKPGLLCAVACQSLLGSRLQTQCCSSGEQVLLPLLEWMEANALDIAEAALKSHRTEVGGAAHRLDRLIHGSDGCSPGPCSVAKDPIRDFQGRLEVPASLLALPRGVYLKGIPA